MRSVMLGVGVLTTSLACVGAYAGGAPVELDPVTVSMNSGEKPQSKLWKHNDTWWAAMPTTSEAPSGVWVWRLDGESWTNVLHISDNTAGQCDVKNVGNVTHILVHGLNASSSELVSIQHVGGGNTQELWDSRPTATGITHDDIAETATIDVDSTGRMWLAVDQIFDVVVYYSDSPYTMFSAPIVLDTGIAPDDITAVAALPNDTVVVTWTDQSSARFGCREHVDGASPSDWGADEVPAEASANDGVGMGMADDHLNLAIGTDSTVYMVVKTGFNTIGFPDVALLVRRPNGTWDDDIYFIEQDGTRGIAMLNELTETLRVAYKQDDPNVDLPYVAYKEASTSDLVFGDVMTLFPVTAAPLGVNNPASTKQVWTSDLVVIATDDTDAGPMPGIRFTDGVEAANGACCFADGSCTFGTEAACGSAGGLYQGDEVECGDIICEVTDIGACCFGDGSCSTQSPTDCTDLGGTYQGTGVGCGDIQCNPPAEPEACCIATSCFDVLAEVCVANGGTPMGEGTSCASINCMIMNCAADIDGDGLIGVADMVEVILGWGECGSMCTADINLDGVQDVEDLVIIITAWGPCP